MVRLKGFRPACKVRTIQFQFHYGTIKRKQPFLFGHAFDISIPLWYD